MNYGYIRVSTDRQDTENQKIGINEKATALGIIIDEWISDDGVSGGKEPEKRLLGALLGKVQSGDVIIVSELSRLGRKLFMIMRVLESLMNKDVKLYSVKDGYNLDNSITSKVLAFAFGLAAEIERDMIQKRTKEGLARRRAQGVILGRPVGRTSKKKLDGKQDEIREYLKIGLSFMAIARIYKCHRITVANFVEENNLGVRQEEPSQLTNASESCHRGKIIDEFLEARKDSIIADIEDGKTQKQIAESYSNDDFQIKPHSVRAFLKRSDLYDFYVKTNREIRALRNVDCGKRY